MAGGCVRGDAQRIGEDGGWCLADELVPCGQPGAAPGPECRALAKDDDEPAVTAMFAVSCPGNSQGEAGLAAVVMLLRLRRWCRSRVATGSRTSSQPAPSLSRVAAYLVHETSLMRRAAIRLACWP